MDVLTSNPAKSLDPIAHMATWIPPLPFAHLRFSTLADVVLNKMPAARTTSLPLPINNAARKGASKSPYSKRTSVSFPNRKRQWRITQETCSLAQLDGDFWRNEGAEDELLPPVKVNGASVIGQLMSKAVSTFVKSQLDKCEDLEIFVGGGNRELLTGNIRQVAVRATSATYKGLKVNNIFLTASNINLGFFGKPKVEDARVPRQFPVRINVLMTNEGLNSSVKSPLVYYAMKDLFQIPEWKKFPPFRVLLKKDELKIIAEKPVVFDPHNIRPISLRFNIEKEGHHLKLEDSSQEITNRGIFPRRFDLGNDTKLLRIGVCPKGLNLVGDFTVYL